MKIIHKHNWKLVSKKIAYYVCPCDYSCYVVDGKIKIFKGAARWLLRKRL